MKRLASTNCSVGGGGQAQAGLPGVFLAGGLLATAIGGWWLLLGWVGSPSLGRVIEAPANRAESQALQADRGPLVARRAGDELRDSRLTREQVGPGSMTAPFTGRGRMEQRGPAAEELAPVLQEGGGKSLFWPGQGSVPTTSADVKGVLEEWAQLLAERQGRFSPEELRALSRWIRSLARAGSVGMDGLRDFLLSGVDAPLTKESGVPSSLRLAALDALRGMDSLDALGVALDVLTRTRQPREVAAIADLLEERAPGQYRQWVVSVARALLEKGGAGPDGLGMGPLLKILGEAGRVTPGELETVPTHQREYAAVALSLLPEGAGLPILVGRLQGPDAGLGNPDGRLALQLVAQMAAEQPRAAAELVAIARRGLIPDALWPDIAALAAGAERIQLNEPSEGATIGRHYLYKEGGTELLYRARMEGAVSVAEARSRLEVIGRLLEAWEGAAARQALAPLAVRLEKAAR